MRFRILLVDDHKFYLKLTKEFLEQHGYIVDTAESGDVAIERLETSTDKYALVLLDYLLEKQTGAEVAIEMLKRFPEQFIAINSSDQSREALQRSWKAGAIEFIDKTRAPEEVLSVIAIWCEKFRDQEEGVKVTRTQSAKLIESIGLIGQSKALADVATSVEQFKNNRKTVLILGESGTGKEKVAIALHNKNPEPFFAVNCATYNGDANLMEAELFGVEKGAYTGAVRDKKGIFEEAGNGTVFLDEIHTLSFKAQQRLLRALQDKVIRPVGSNREYQVNCRLLVASKPALDVMAENNEFLLDLYYRLNVLRIEVPPLRDRPEDIAPLIQYFCKRHNEESKEDKVFLTESIHLLKRYSWPGNVRELEHTVERLCLTTQHRAIGTADLDAKFSSRKRDELLLAKKRKNIEVDALERDKVIEILKESRTQREAARRLGMKSTTFHDYLTRLGITKAMRQKAVNNE